MGRLTHFCIGLLLFLAAGCRDHDTPNGAASRQATEAPSISLQVVDPPPSSRYSGTWNKVELNHSLWGQTLQSFVDRRGRVKYGAIMEYPPYAEYLYRLSRTNADELASDAERLAFWINAYNALTIKAVLQTLPEAFETWPDYQIKEVRVNGQSIWKGLRFKVGGGEYSLDEIENEILRKREGLQDPRIHVALVCAARGCPALWNRAYAAESIDQQLAEAMKRFLNDPSQFTADAEQGIIRISKIFEWYGGDFVSEKFTPHAVSIPIFLADYCGIRALSEALRSRDWRLEFNDYDWRLNIQE